MFYPVNLGSRVRMTGMAPGPDPRPLTGEPLSLDLLNTVWIHAGRTHDLLDDREGLRVWLAGVGLADRCEPTEPVRLALRAARDAIRAHVDAATADRETGSDAASAAAGPLNAVLARGNLVRALGPDGPVAMARADDPAHLAAWCAADDYLRLLGRDPSRIRRCAHPQCVLYFYDTSPLGNRRWCSMAGCGNRAKAARHYARRGA